MQMVEAAHETRVFCLGCARLDNLAFVDLPVLAF